jgi:hypothetical protein
VIGSFAVAPDINFPRTLVKARPDLKTKLWTGKARPKLGRLAILTFFTS